MNIGYVEEPDHPLIVLSDLPVTLSEVELWSMLSRAGRIRSIRTSRYRKCHMELLQATIEFHDEASLPRATEIASQLIDRLRLDLALFVLRNIL